MIRLPVLAFSVFCLASLGTMRNADAQQVLDGVAAQVNNQIITFSQVRDLVGAKERAANDQYRGTELVEKVKEIRLAALNDLIDRELILQEFKEMQKKGASIPSHVIQEHMDTLVREQFGGDRSAFVRTLAAQGYSMDRFRQMEEEKIIVGAMRGQHMGTNSFTIVPDAKIKEYYQKHLEDYTSDEQLKLRMLVMKKSTAEEDNRYKMMQEIRQKITGGAAFADLARMYTEDGSRQEAGGDWGWINKRMLSDPLTKAAFALKPGQVSPIIELSGNYYLLTCEARKGAIVQPFAEVRDQIEKTLMQQSRQEEQQRWIAKLRSKAYIKIY